MVAVSSSPAVTAALARYSEAASDETLAIADPDGIDGISASVKCRVPRKLIVTTRNGSPMPDDTPATLKRTSTGPSIAATAVSIDAASDRSSSWNSLSCRRGLLQVKADDLRAELGELPRDLGADARGAAGDNRAPAVVTPEVVDLSHVLRLISGRVPAVPSLPRLELRRSRFDTCVHLVHRQGHLVGGELLPAGGQPAERVGLVECRARSTPACGPRPSRGPAPSAWPSRPTAFSSRSMNSGRTSLPISSMDSIVPRGGAGSAAGSVSSTPLSS